MGNIKVAQYGTGMMSRYIMKYAIEKGYNIVAAFDINKDVIGKDVGQIIEGDLTGIKINDVKNAEKILKETKPDICIITTMSLLRDVYESFKLCAELGINVISSCEEAFYPMNSSPSIAKELDNVARLNNCTITGSGYQDIYWCNLVSVIAGGMHKITKIKCISSYNIEDFGLEFIKSHGAGLNVLEFNREISIVDKISITERNELIQKGEFRPSYMWNSSYALAKKLGLEVISQMQRTLPHTYINDVNSHTLDINIPAGDVTGMISLVTTKTKEGIDIETECTGKICPNNEDDKTEWKIYGEPDNLVVTVNKPPFSEITCATIVNRIPDVINAEPGFRTIDTMNYVEYKF